MTFLQETMSHQHHNIEHKSYLQGTDKIEDKANLNIQISQKIKISTKDKTKIKLNLQFKQILTISKDYQIKKQMKIVDLEINLILI